MIYYIKIKNTVSGNPRYLISLRGGEANLVYAKKATDKQALTIYTDQGESIYLGYIVSTYSMDEVIETIKKWRNI